MLNGPLEVMSGYALVAAKKNNLNPFFIFIKTKLVQYCLGKAKKKLKKRLKKNLFFLNGLAHNPPPPLNGPTIKRGTFFVVSLTQN